MTPLEEVVAKLRVGVCLSEEKRAECATCQRTLELIAVLEKLPDLLERARGVLHDGFIGGEWANYVPEEICVAAAREHDEALTVRDEIAEILKDSALIG